MYFNAKELHKKNIFSQNNMYFWTVHKSFPMSNFQIKSLEEYFKVYRRSIREPEVFWEEIAEEHFVWRKKWNSGRSRYDL